MKVSIPNLLGIFLLLSCNVEEPTTPDLPVSPTFEIDQNDPNPNETLSMELTPETRLPAIFSVVTWTEKNLDADPYLEEILLVEQTVDDQREVELWIGDYSNVSQDVHRVWSSSVLSVAFTNMEIDFLDVTGNHNEEILIFGRNERGFRTLDIFSREISENSLTYQSIFTQSSPGTIRIEELPRSIGYDSGQVRGASFDLVVEENTSSQTSDLQIAQNVFRFSIPSNQYRLHESTMIDPLDTSSTELENAIAEGAEAMLSFLEGPWYLADESQEPQIVVFRTREMEFQLLEGPIQEVYEITSFYRPIRTRLSLELRNQISTPIEYLFTVSIKGPEEILILPHRSFHLSGTFFRLAESDKAAMVVQETTPELLFQPRGLFRSDVGSEIIFDLPSFILEEAGETYGGAAALFWVGSWILQLNILDSGQQLVEVRNYRVDFKLDSQDERISRIIEMTPGRLGIRGFEESIAPVIQWEQVELLSAE